MKRSDMSELSEAFVCPVDRSVATAGSKMLDRISVRDYIVNAEIGAFKVEHGVKQKIKVSVVLEILPHNAFETDNVDKVISYDSLVNSIDNHISEERVNLLETLAERIAQSCLNDVRAVRVFVRIEKLEKILGGLGVEIVRENISDLSKIQNTVTSSVREKKSLCVLNLRENYLKKDLLKLFIEKLEKGNEKYIIMVSNFVESTNIQFDNINDFYVSLLAIDQAAWSFAKKSKRFIVADSRAELDWAINNGRIPIWAPYGMLSKAINLPKKLNSTPLYLCCWLAQETKAEDVIQFRDVGTNNIQSKSFYDFEISVKSIDYESFLSDRNTL